MYTKESIAEKTITLVADTLKVPKEKVQLNSILTELAADSIEVFELITVFENAFEIKTEYDRIVRIETVGDIVEYLSDLLGVKDPVQA